MIGPADGGTARGGGTPTGATGTRDTVGAVLAVLGLGLALRLIIAYLLPGSGFLTDINAFDFWGRELQANGPYGFFDRPFFHDYTPGYLYALWFVYEIVFALGLQNIGDTIPMFQAFGLKLVPLLADLAIGWLVHSMVLELGGARRAALLAAALAVFNPISWFDSQVWGQADSVGVAFLLLALRELWRDRPERSAVFTMIAAIIKPQLGIMVPFLAVVTIRRALWPAGGHGNPERTGRPLRILTTGFAGFATAVILCLPFGLSVIELTPQAPFVRSELLAQVGVAAGGYPYLTVNAFNLWALLPSDTGISLANSTAQWVCDFSATATGNAQAIAYCAQNGTGTLAGIPAVFIGTTLLLLTGALILAIVARRPDRWTLLVGLAVLSLAFFVVPTRVHERYGYPFFALGAILAAVTVRWRVAYVALSVATFLNLYAVITTLYPDNPSIRDWLGIGPLIVSEPGITAIALAHGISFLWALVEVGRESMRPAEARENEEPDAYMDQAHPSDIAPITGPDHGPPDASQHDPIPPGPERPAPFDRPVLMAHRAEREIALPTWRRPPPFSEVGPLGWLRARVLAPPARPDRTASLAGEGGGRLDRLDLWFLVVLLLAGLFLRTFRLAEPYQMQFDEVYHARTGTEFLQGWRYGIEHDIYEWTHPHLAKYAMAAGLVLWGGDNVKATSALGTTVKDALIEPRRPSAGAPGGRTVERLHVATGNEVRTFELRTRTLQAVVRAPGVSALAWDATGKRLVLGYENGSIATLDAATLGIAGVDVGPDPTPLVRVDHAIRRVMVSDDGTTIAAASDDRLSLVDAATASVISSIDLPGITDLAPGGAGPALVATLAEIGDRGEAATTLAELLGGSVASFTARLNDPPAAETVIVGGVGNADTREAVNAAIADGSLPGFRVEEVARIAVATSDGVTFLDTGEGAIVARIAISGGAHGMASVTGLEDPKLYVSAGDASAPTYAVIATGGQSAEDGPVKLADYPLPGPGTEVVYDESSQQVHILGRVPGSSGGDGEGWTVYVIEPHANAVYADARLPADFEPTAVAANVEAGYPGDDPQRLFVFDRAGTVAEIDIGSHAFAWRLPGVIAGALTAVLLYLLARILFQRRLIAGLVGLFVLVDGMFFVQARVGMNDAYVGLFIVAAYTLFAAIWTGWWRGRWAVILGLPATGLLLGLALASKWVAAYAIGALLLLILVRSALGRFLAICGLIGITAVLGYLAISVPEGSGFGNLTFLLIMVGLTLVAVVTAVLHPIAWTREELWTALLLPVIAGGMVVLLAVATARVQEPLPLGSVILSPLQIAGGLFAVAPLVAVGFWLGGHWGFGPLARAPSSGDPARYLDPPAPAPRGWLRPGSALGIPIVWAALCMVALPLAVYVVSYVPWAMIGGHQIVPGWPPGHEGQTLLDLTAQMYRYHNDLAAAHPASSPWWAWPFDLKPVWFYQESLAGSTSAATYDAGSLVIWWLGVAAMAFVAVMAFRRRSLALALIAVGFAAQWVPWARIDRAAFQYHYYTALPFVVLALAYFVAELWNGPSRRTWLLARVAAALAIVGPAMLWTFSRPLCGFVGVLSVNPGSQACPPYIPSFVLTARGGALTLIVAVGLIVLVSQLLAFDGGNGRARGPIAALGTLIGAAIAIVAALIVASLLPDTAVLTLTTIPVEPIAAIVGLPLMYLAFRVLEARDPRRFVAGYLVAAVSWFLVLYPNIAALPLPSVLVNAYQGIVPTYLYAFQFPVSTVARGSDTPLLTPTLAVLVVALAVTCLVVAYSAWAWRLALADSSASDGGSEVDADGLARTGGP